MAATHLQVELYTSGRGTYQVELGRFTHATDGSITNLKQTLQIIGEADGGSSISEWDSTVTYKDGDIVYRDGNIYLCIADEADGDPPETLLDDSWELISKGEKPRGELSIIATFNITEANTVITLQNLVGLTSIDWGDGTTDSSLTHTYTAVGEYTAKIYGVTNIGDHAFGQCSNLTSVFLSNSITEIGQYAFWMTKNLTYLTIPDSVTVIREGAISECRNLKRLTVGKGIKEIERWNIVTYTHLEVFEIEAYTPPIINWIDTSHLKKIIVPLESLEAYKTAEGWSDYATLICSYVYTTDRNEFVKECITQNTLTMTDEEKASACEWLGATPFPKQGADNGTFTVLMPNGTRKRVTLAYSNRPSVNSPPIYNPNKTIMVNNAVNDTDAPNWGQVKTYVDNKFDIIDSILSQSGISYQADIVDTYTERITADSENVLDGSKAVLKKVVGNTVSCKNLFDAEYWAQNYQSNGQINIVLTNGNTYTISCVSNIERSDTWLCAVTEDETVASVNIERRLIFTKKGTISLTFTITDDGKVYQLGFCRSGAPVLSQWLSFFNGDYCSDIQVEEGATATEYQPYFTGLKSASFGGIESGGKNLFDTSFIKNRTYANGSSVTVNSDGSIHVVKKAGDAINFNTKTNFPAGTYTLSNGLTRGSEVYFTFANAYTISKPSHTITFKGGEETLYLYSQPNVEDDVVLKPQLEHGTTATEYTPYISPYLYEFPKTPTPMGTTIDFENKKITKEYEYLEQSTPFTEEQLTSYTDYIISKDGKSIMYKLSTPIETPFTAQQSASGNEYTAYKNGTEKVLENDGGEFNADNTLTQNYLFVKEVK